MSAESNTRRQIFRGWIYEFDRILRGEKTSTREIYRTDPKRANIDIPVGGIAVLIGLLGVLYGLCMAVFALVRGVESSDCMQAYLQTLASMTKVPLLFLLTIVVTFPSLYVFNSIVGSQLRIGPIFRLLIASMAVNLAVLASLGPIVAFFSACTPNYSFVVLLNVLVFTVAGLIGIAFLLQTLKRLTQPAVVMALTVQTQPEDLVDAGHQEIVSRRLPSKSGNDLIPTGGFVAGHVRMVFATWLIVFGLVGAQMGWVLRPFIGSPSLPFEWFRPRHSNFFSAIWHTLQNLFC